MRTQLQQQIFDTIQEMVQMERVDEQLKVTKKELKHAYREHDDLDKEIRKGLKDIEKLEGLSTKAIFHKILGSKEKQLEKERQDYLELSLKEEDTKNSIKLLEYEVNLLEAKLGSKEKLKKQLELLKQKREAEIIKTNPSLRAKLMDISQELESNYQYKVELNEAIEVGEVCYSLVKQVIGHLTKVRNWGQWPGRSRRRSNMTRYAQRDAIDRARNLSFQIKHHLNLFSNELKDLGKRIPFNTDTSKFSDFSDFFFNNIITDWILQQQLTNALGSAKNLKDNLEGFISKLKKEFNKIDSTISKLNDHRDQVLTS